MPQSQPLNHRQAVWLMVLITLMWSIAGLVSRQLVQAKGFEVTFWRSFFTLICLLIALPLWQGKQVFGKIVQGGRALWLSGLCWAVMFTAYMLAMTMTRVANVLVTMALGPLMTALVARVMIGHRIAPRTWLAIAVAGVGIFYMYGSQLLDAQTGAGQGSLSGTLVALCVPVAAAVNWTILHRNHSQGHEVDLIPAVMVGAFFSSLFALPMAWPFHASSTDLAWLSLLGVVQLALPCVLSLQCAKVLKAPELSLLALLEVIFGILLVWLGADEAPGHNVLVGGALVIGALVANEWHAWRAKETL